jgi:hypothetical protein
MADPTSDPREFTQVELDEDVISLPLLGNAWMYCIVCGEEHIYGECPNAGKCFFCKKRPATLHFGDALSFTHGGGLNCCELCCAIKQRDHARERAAALPELEERVRVLEEQDDKE